MSEAELRRGSPVASFVRDVSEGIHPAIPLTALAITLSIDTWLRLQMPGSSIPSWQWRLGATIGMALTIAIPFLAWAYFVIVVFLSLVVLDEYIEIRKLGDVIANAFAAAAIGKAAEVMIRIGGAEYVAPWFYIVAAAGGLVLSAYGIHVHLGVPAVRAYAVVGFALVGLIAVSYTWFH